MIRALQYATRFVFFSPENNKYRYWYSPSIIARNGDGVMKIQITRAELARFKASEGGMVASRYVDMFEVGGGWYELHSADNSEFEKAFGVRVDGVKMWVRELNRWNVGMVNANRPRVNVAYKGKGIATQQPIIEPRQRPASTHALNKLVNMFAKH